ncbi:PREDICTED: zinc finger and SCAN domain-containing protein 31-like [Gekko japonicus]|uniref:Zinc finger and SCAN domain-containing protein 31-like n=1 Tax=Gekko japonicus TaxID=146911 RepID=A0ABM1JLB0_GEKJA|nr:PREDICTED: zinc finger and SCAN domain-containing protein 31-like [Gekko japonicus]
MVHPESMKEQPRWRAWREGREEPHWEAQWQDFLGRLDPPQAGWGKKHGPWEDTKAFLASFEQVAQACQWPRGEWVVRLLPALSGEAQQAFESLEAGDREDYGKVKVAIMRWEANRMETLRQHFRQFRSREVEDPRRIYSQLQELCCRWLRPERHSKEQILELLILEQFLAILPPELQSWIRAGEPETCAQAVALVEDFLLSQQEAEAEKWQVSPMNVKEAGVAVRVIEQSPTELGPRTMFWQVLQEDRENVDSLEKEDVMCIQFPEERERRTGRGSGGGKGIPLKGKNSPCGESEPEDTVLDLTNELATTPEIQEQRDKFKNLAGRKLVKGRDESSTFTGIRTAPSSKTTLHEGPNLPLASEYGRRCRYKSGLVMIHAGEDSYECPVWEEEFQQNPYLRNKPRSHPGTGFSDGWRNVHQGEALLRHPATYPVENGYECSECGKSLSCRRTLKAHKRIHTGERPYECSYCGKFFSHSMNLKRHQKLHTGESLYECPECGKNFYRRDKFIEHQRIHTGEKPYGCLQCGKSFSHRGTLVSHQRIHIGR